MTPGAWFGDMGHPANCGHVSPGAGTEKGHHPGDCEHVTLCTGLDVGYIRNVGYVNPGPHPGDMDV